jgi:hypothetical protein
MKQTYWKNHPYKTFWPNKRNFFSHRHSATVLFRVKSHFHSCFMSIIFSKSNDVIKTFPEWITETFDLKPFMSVYIILRSQRNSNGKRRSYISDDLSTFFPCRILSYQTQSSTSKIYFFNHSIIMITWLICPNSAIVEVKPRGTDLILRKISFQNYGYSHQYLAKTQINQMKIGRNREITVLKTILWITILV